MGISYEQDKNGIKWWKSPMIMEKSMFQKHLHTGYNTMPQTIAPRKTCYPVVYSQLQSQVKVRCSLATSWWTVNCWCFLWNECVSCCWNVWFNCMTPGGFKYISCYSRWLQWVIPVKGYNMKCPGNHLVWGSKIKHVIIY